MWPRRVDCDAVTLRQPILQLPSLGGAEICTYDCITHGRATDRMANMADGRTIHGVTHSAPTFTVPAGATDCHVHVFGPDSRYPISGLPRLHRRRRVGRKPRGASARARAVPRRRRPAKPLRHRQRLLGRCDRPGSATGRGVAVIDPDRIADADLAALHAGDAAPAPILRPPGDRPRYRVEIVVRACEGGSRRSAGTSRPTPTSA